MRKRWNRTEGPFEGFKAAATDESKGHLRTRARASHENDVFRIVHHSGIYAVDGMPTVFLLLLLSLLSSVVVLFFHFFSSVRLFLVKKKKSRPFCTRLSRTPGYCVRVVLLGKYNIPSARKTVVYRRDIAYVCIYIYIFVWQDSWEESEKYCKKKKKNIYKRRFTRTSDNGIYD